MRELVFIHGRAQQQKDPAGIKKAWIEAWRYGLAKSNLELPIEETQIRFPYYGDTLDQLSRGMDESDAARIIIMGELSDADEREFVMAYLSDMQDKLGISDADVRAQAGVKVNEMGPQDWGWVHLVLKTLDSSVPGASGSSVALFTHDVYQYLKQSGIRDVMDEGVRKAFSPGVETVVVSHSLGTIVAYNVLRRDAEMLGLKVPLFMTLGSPLGVNVVRQSLTPIRYPKRAGMWVNAFDPRDIVALYPLDAAHFGVNPTIENIPDVVNWTDNRHGIAGYLDNQAVARRIYDALTI